MSPLIIKTRQEPSELVILKTLKSRFTLSKEDQTKYYNLNKGLEGEQQFDALLENLQCECLILNDLLLTINNQRFQIDSLLIFNNKIHLYEIKNYVDDFYFESNQLFKKDGFEISNPLIQLERSTSLLRQLLLKNNFQIPIQSFVIFINPEFSLLQAPLDKPFILSSQLNRFLKDINKEGVALTQQHKKIAEKLIALNMKDYPLQQYPLYSYENIQKGIHCLHCNSFSFKTTTNRCLEVVCLNCGRKEQLESALARTIKDYQILFPQDKITTNKTYEWCAKVISKKTIRRFLKVHFSQTGSNRWTFYS